jgi:hypothetical protein
VDALSTEAAFAALAAVLEAVQSRDCAHNVVFFSDACADVSAIVYCRAKAVGVKDVGSVHIAISEVAGHLFAKSREAFDKYSAEELDALVEEIQLPPDVFRAICEDVVSRVLLLENAERDCAQPQPEEQITADATTLQPEQLLDALSQLHQLRSQLVQEIDSLKTEIGSLQKSSDESHASLQRLAAVHAHCPNSVESQKHHSDSSESSFAYCYYFVFAIIAVFAAWAYHQHSAAVSA